MNGSLAYEYRATVQRWLDGDTCDVTIDLGFSISRTDRVRLYGLNAPEIHSRNAAEKAAGRKALEYVEKLCPPGTQVTLRTYKAGDDAGDKFGRFLGCVVLPEGRVVNDVLLTEGLVKPWDGVGAKPI